MNYIDIVVIIFLGLISLIGYFRGAIRELGDLLITGLSVLAAVLSFQWLSLFLHLPSIIPTSYLKSFSFFLVWFVAEIILYLLFFIIVNRLPLGITDSKVTKYTGPVVAVIKGGGLLVLILSIMLLMPLGNDLTADLSGSFSARSLTVPARAISGWFTANFSDITKYSKFVSAGDSGVDKTNLGFVVSNPAEDTLSANRLTDLINSSRSAGNVDKFTVDEKISAVALAHAKDLAKSGYLSQPGSDGKTLSDRMATAGQYFYLGENAAAGKDASAIYTGMLANSADSSNILSETFTTFGVGVVDLGAHGILAVVEFAN